jgi:blue light- and temperature-responsive anti-repressor
MPLERLAYVSRSTASEDQLLAFSDILAQSVRNNRANGITGALTFTPGRYAQILEGEGHALDTLLGKISADPRHCDMRIWDRSPIEARLFPEWSMIAPGFSPDGRTRLAHMLARDDVDMRQITDLILELLVPGDGKPDPFAGSGLV